MPETYEFCHGNADLVLLTYSGRDVQSTFDFGKRLLRDSGLRDVKLLPLNSSALQLVQEADVIWFGGGSQKNQVLALARVPKLLTALRAAHQSGTVMMGSSAGAAVMSKLMISGDGNGTAYTRAGLGFLPNVVLDQHVVARHREWRLQQVISNNRHLIGLGIDEGAGVMFRGSECSVINGRVLLTQWNSGAISQARLKRGKTIRI